MSQGQHRHFSIKSRIEGQPNLVRPKNGGGVINLDQEGYQRALARVRVSEKRKQLEQRVESVEQKLDQILNLLLRSQP